MKQDKQLKEILLNSAEGASVDFTKAVMKKVYSISAASPYYQPLVSSKLKKGFVFAFGATVAAILCLCLVITLGRVDIVGWIQSIPLAGLNYNKLLVFIFTFWTLFILKGLFEKNFELHRNRVTFKRHE